MQTWDSSSDYETPLMAHKQKAPDFPGLFVCVRSVIYFSLCKSFIICPRNSGEAVFFIREQLNFPEDLTK
jgi:hypothetical protein